MKKTKAKPKKSAGPKAKLKVFGSKKKVKPIEKPEPPPPDELLEPPVEDPVPPIPDLLPEPLVELPAPPSPKAKLKTPAKSIARVEGDWNRYEVGPGKGALVYNSVDASMTAHCSRHGGRCRAPKVLKKKGMGYYLLWLQKGESIPEGSTNAAEHLAMRLRRCIVSFGFFYCRPSRVLNARTCAQFSRADKFLDIRVLE